MTQEVTIVGPRLTSAPGVGRGAVSITEKKGRRMRRLVIAALARGEMNVPTGKCPPRRRVVNPKAVYGSQRGHARALYRRINGVGAAPAEPVTFRHTAVGAADDGFANRELGPGGRLLGSLAFWGAVALGLVARVARRSSSASRGASCSVATCRRLWFARTSHVRATTSPGQASAN